MKTVNSINFVVRESKTRRNGTAPIEVNLNKNGERASFSTGKSIKVSEWDKVSQRVRGKDRVSMELNNYLDSIRARLYRLEIELMDRGMDITVNMLRDAYMGKLDCMKDWSLLSVIEAHLNDLRGMIGKWEVRAIRMRVRCCLRRKKTAWCLRRIVWDLVI